jgi:hypothetical protein
MQETAADATFAFMVDGVAEKTISRSDFSTVEKMQNFEFVVDVDTGTDMADGSVNHTFSFVDTTPSQGNYVGYSLDSIVINDWFV